MAACEEFEGGYRVGGTCQGEGCQDDDWVASETRSGGHQGQGDCGVGKDWERYGSGHVWSCEWQE